MKRILSLVLSLCLVLGLCACGGSVSVDKWQEQYDLGIRYLSEGNYEEAIIAFTAAIKIDPKQPDAYVGLAEVYVAQSDTDKAVETLSQALKKVGENEQVLAMLRALGYELGEDGQLIMPDWNEVGQIITDTIYALMDDSSNPLALEAYWFMTRDQREEIVRPVIKQLEYLAEQEPGAYLNTLFDAYYILGDMEQALTVREKLYTFWGDEQYNPNGYVREYLTHNNEPVELTYNSVGCTTQYVRTTADGGTEIQLYEYGEDGAIIKETTDFEGFESYPPGVSPDHTTVYEYDGEGRILKCTNQSFGYLTSEDGRTVLESWPIETVHELSYEAEGVRMTGYSDGTVVQEELFSIPLL